MTTTPTQHKDTKITASTSCAISPGLCLAGNSRISHSHGGGGKLTEPGMDVLQNVGGRGRRGPPQRRHIPAAAATGGGGGREPGHRGGRHRALLAQEVLHVQGALGAGPGVGVRGGEVQVGLQTLQPALGLQPRGGFTGVICKWEEEGENMPTDSYQTGGFWTHADAPRTQLSAGFLL